jgi:hypothetical protein
VKNKSGVCSGVKKLVVNGEEISGNVIPLAKMTDVTKVVAEM